MNIKYLLVIFVCAFLTSCEYDAPFSTKDDTQFDKRILGVWKSIDESHPSLNFSNVLILKTNENEFVVKVLEKGENYYFIGFTFKLDKYDFIQLKFIGIEDGKSYEDLVQKDSKLKKYMLIKYEFVDKDLSVQLINKELIPTTITSQKKLLEMLKSKIDSKELFGTKCLFKENK